MAATPPRIIATGFPAGKRLLQYNSTRLLHEWAGSQPWNAGPWYELRLGPVPLAANQELLTEKERAMLTRWNRYADLVGVGPSSIRVVEAKMLLDPGAISQLTHYVNLLRLTPVLRDFSYLPFESVIVVAIDDPVVHQLANAAGHQVVVFTPPWVGDWMTRRMQRPGKKRARLGNPVVPASAAQAALHVHTTQFPAVPPAGSDFTNAKANQIVIGVAPTGG